MIDPTPRHGRRAVVACALVLGLAATASPAAAYRQFTPGGPSAGLRGAPAPTPKAGDIVPGEIIVRFADDQATSADARSLGATIARRLPIPGTVTLKVSSRANTRALAASFNRRSDVLWAEPNRYQEFHGLPNDARVGELWGMNNGAQTIRGINGVADIDANLSEAWNTVTGGDAIVGIVDSGVAITHPDLAENIWNNPGETGTDAQGRDKRTNGADDDGNLLVDDWRGWDFHKSDNDPTDMNGHGSHVAGTVAAVGNNGLGVSGASQRAKILALKVGGDNRDDGSIKGDAAAAALAYAGSKGARVVNGSFGGPTAQQAQEDAIAAHPGTLYVLSAGNEAKDNDATASFPCNYNRPNIICVASLDNKGGLSSFSNFGVKNVDLGAPGSAILSTAPFAFLLDDPFEDPISGRWTQGGTGPANWGVAPGSQSDGSKAAWSNGGSPMPSNSQRWIISKQVDLSGCTQSRLETTLSAEFANGEIDLSITDNADPNATGSYKTIDHSGGAQVATTRLTYDLGIVDHDGDPNTAGLNYNGKKVHFIIGAFTGNGESLRGAAVEEFQVSCVPNAPTGTEYQYLSGTSMSSPMVAGVATLVASQYPGGDMGYLRSAILGSVIPTGSLAGKTVTGGRLNAAGAIDTQGPSAPPLTGPGPGAVTADRRPPLAWGPATDAKTGIRSYELVVDGAPAATTDANGRAGQPPAPLGDGAHSWRVDAIDGAGLRTGSETRTFTVDGTGPKLTAGKVAKRTRRTAAARGFAVECRLGEAGTCTVELRIARSDARRLKLKIGKSAKTLLLGKATKKVGSSGKATITVKPNRKAAKAIRRSRRKIGFRLTLIGKDALGNTSTRTVSRKI